MSCFSSFSLPPSSLNLEGWQSGRLHRGANAASWGRERPMNAPLPDGSTVLLYLSAWGLPVRTPERSQPYGPPPAIPPGTGPLCRSISRLSYKAERRMNGRFGMRSRDKSLALLYACRIGGAQMRPKEPFT